MQDTGVEMFPFKLEDLVAWTVKRSDGQVIRFNLQEAAKNPDVTAGKLTQSVRDYTSTSKVTTSHLKEWCNHTPTDTPVAEFDPGDRPEGIEHPLRLYCGDAAGAKKTVEAFDFVIDGGDVISMWGRKTSKTLEGDPQLVEALAQYCVEVPHARILKLDWIDRCAPDVVPEFWVQLNKLLHGDVMTCCVGGHGRTGTSFCSLLLANAPDYDALDALVHLRAVHCPRAIESATQHQYIDDVAKFLDREPNIAKGKEIKDYKGAFMASTRPTAVRTRKMLGWK